MTLRHKPLTGVALILGLACLFATLATAQPSTQRPPKTILLDADGRTLTDEQFVDRRLANPHEKKDPATRTVHPDGTIEFRLSRVPQEGTGAPVFETATVDGTLLGTASLKGKVTVVNFWFIGCIGCMSEIPALNGMAKKYKDESDLVFVALAPDTPQALRQFRTREGFEYQMVGNARPIIDLFQFEGFPRNIVIDRSGKIVYWRSTIRAWNEFEAVINVALASK